VIRTAGNGVGRVCTGVCQLTWLNPESHRVDLDRPYPASVRAVACWRYPDFHRAVPSVFPDVRLRVHRYSALIPNRHGGPALDHCGSPSEPFPCRPV